MAKAHPVLVVLLLLFCVKDVRAQDKPCRLKIEEILCKGDVEASSVYNCNGCPIDTLVSKTYTQCEEFVKYKCPAPQIKPPDVTPPVPIQKPAAAVQWTRREKAELGAGIAGLAVGAALLGVGVAMIENKIPTPMDCSYPGVGSGIRCSYLPAGATLTAIGGLVIVGGVVFITLGSSHHRKQQQVPADKGKNQ